MVGGFLLPNSRSAKGSSAATPDLRAATSRPPLFFLVDLGLLAQHRIEQRTVNFDLSIVVDETVFAELVHEKTYPRTRGADHFRQRLLTERHRHRRRIAFLAEIGEQQEQAGPTPLAGIEELVDQVVFDPAVSRQQIGNEKLGE